MKTNVQQSYEALQKNLFRKKVRDIANLAATYIRRSISTEATFAARS